MFRCGAPLCSWRTISRVGLRSQAAPQLAELRAVRSYIVEAAVDERMSHRQIAELLGVTHTAVQKILQEAGRRRDILGRINVSS